MTTAQLEYFEKECQEDFKTIKASLDAFNIFEVLKIHRREIRHSNFLGWLFDPNGSHNLGDIFLKELIIFLTKETCISYKKNRYHKLIAISNLY